MIKAILFDFDGTIVDSLKHHLYAWKKSFNLTGSNLTNDEVIKKIFYQFDGEDNPKYRIDGRRLELYYEHLEEAFENLEKHQHIDGFLKSIYEKNIKISIISFADSGRIRIHLIRLGIDKYFEFVLGGDDVKKGKPDPEIAFTSMEKLNVKPEETLLIGDTNWDILTGKNAGTRTALFIPETNLEYIDINLYRSTNPDFEFNNFKDFEELLRKKELI